MIYKFRVILDVDEDVFRDIEIEDSASLENLHNAIKQHMGFTGNEMASFYLCDDAWAQGEEIVLLNMEEASENVRLMSEALLKDVVRREDIKLVYVYDFMNLWTCYVALMKVGEPEEGKIYPNLLYAYGELPKEAPQKQLQTEILSSLHAADDELDIQHYNDFNFEEHWN